MGRVRLLSYLAIAAATMTVFGTVASADTKSYQGEKHYGPPGEPTQGAAVGACVVNLAIVLDNGVSQKPTHDTYTISQPSATCTGSNFGSGPGGAVPEAYQLSGTGHTDGPNQVDVEHPLGPMNHGETTALGWSWQKGDIDVSNGPVQCGERKAAIDGGLNQGGTKPVDANWVEYERKAGKITVWGHLVWTAGCRPKSPSCFKGELTPIVSDPGPKVKAFFLEGLIVLWDETPSTLCQAAKQSEKQDPKQQ